MRCFLDRPPLFTGLSPNAAPQFILVEMTFGLSASWAYDVQRFLYEVIAFPTISQLASNVSTAQRSGFPSLPKFLDSLSHDSF